MIFRTRPPGQPRGAIRPAFLPPHHNPFVIRRANFGPHELREDRIRAEGHLADDLSPAARRVLRSGEVA